MDSWTRLKTKIAKLILQGISIAGMFFGFSLVYFGIAIVPSVPRDDRVFLCLSLILVGMLLMLAIYLLYTFYLMFRGRAFRAIELLAAGLAVLVFGPVVNSVYHFAVTRVSGIQARTVVGLASYFAALSLSVLVYLLCSRLLKELVEVAYHPEEVSRE